MSVTISPADSVLITDGTIDNPGIPGYEVVKLTILPGLEDMVVFPSVMNNVYNEAVPLVNYSVRIFNPVKSVNDTVWTNSEGVNVRTRLSPTTLAKLFGAYALCRAYPKGPLQAYYWMVSVRILSQPPKSNYPLGTAYIYNVFVRDAGGFGDCISELSFTINPDLATMMDSAFNIVERNSAFFINYVPVSILAETTNWYLVKNPFLQPVPGYETPNGIELYTCTLRKISDGKYAEPYCFALGRGVLKPVPQRIY